MWLQRPGVHRQYWLPWMKLSSRVISPPPFRGRRFGALAVGEADGSLAALDLQVVQLDVAVLAGELHAPDGEAAQVEAADTYVGSAAGEDQQAARAAPAVQDGRLAGIGDEGDGVASRAGACQAGLL
jgi:hypothetical protein